jgi:hypothetical protein
LESFVKSKPAAFGFTIMTRHLTLSSLCLTVTVYLPDTARGFGFWLRRAGARNTGTAFCLWFVHFARPAFRPAALFCIITGCERLGFGTDLAALAPKLRQIPANLLVYFHIADTIPKRNGYCNKNL